MKPTQTDLIEPTQTELIGIVRLMRNYGRRILDGLQPEQLNWVLPESKGKPIIYYFAHIMNAEIYWLIHLGDHTFDYVGKDATFEDGLKLYDRLQDYLVSKISESDSNEDFQLRHPEIDGKEIVVRGSLGWMIWRTSMHALHHFAQIAFIRHTLGYPPEKGDEFEWGRVMDKVVTLAHGEEK
ncbi:MAG: DinB family protein [Promethearchaeota archaeon]